jgi:signal transduction histidine kinase
MTATNVGAASRTGAQYVLALAGVALAGLAGYHWLTFGSNPALAALVALSGILLGAGGWSLRRLSVEPRWHLRVVAAAIVAGVVVAVLGVLAQSTAGRAPTVENGGAGVAFLGGAGALVGLAVGVSVARERQLRRRLASAESTAERLAEERGRFEVLNRATRSLLRAEDPESVAETLVEEGRVGLPGPFAGVWLYESARNRLVPAGTTSTDPQWTPQQLWPDDGAMRAFEAGEPRPIVDAGLPDMDELYAIPIGEYGLLVVGAPREFDERERTLAEVYARTAEVTMDRIEREQELARNNERLEAFSSVLAHDLRSPLNVVEGRVRMAEQTGDTQDLDRVLDAVDRMDAIIADVLELARDGEAVIEPEPTPLDEVAEAAWESVDTRQARLGLEALPTVEGDPERLARLFENLFRNAVEHGGHHVHVRVALLEDRHGFFVADDGPGIPPDERNRILDEGYSLDNRTGIGLAIVRQIAHAHDWTIRVEGSETGGARFEFELPGEPDEGVLARGADRESDGDESATGSDDGEATGDESGGEGGWAETDEPDPNEQLDLDFETE